MARPCNLAILWALAAMPFAHAVKAQNGVIAFGPNTAVYHCRAGAERRAQDKGIYGTTAGLDAVTNECCKTTLMRNVVNVNSPILLFPRSLIELAWAVRNQTVRDWDFNFIGAVLRGPNYAGRGNIVPFARKKFTERSYFLMTDKIIKYFPKHAPQAMQDEYNSITDPAQKLKFFRERASRIGVKHLPAQDIAWDYQHGKTLGPFDRTLDYNMTAFVPLDNMGGAQKPKTWDSPFAGTNNHCGMAAYDLGYLRVLARSKFTMAPRGDRPWSQRFFEAIMAGSIPIVQNMEHTGRGPKERALGYKVYLQNENTKYEYREDWARHNLKIFIEHQSLLRKGTNPFERGADGPGPLLSCLPYIMNRTLALKDFHFEGQENLPSEVGQLNGK